MAQYARARDRSSQEARNSRQPVSARCFHKLVVFAESLGMILTATQHDCLHRNRRNQRWIWFSCPTGATSCTNDDEIWHEGVECTLLLRSKSHIRLWSDPSPPKKKNRSRRQISSCNVSTVRASEKSSIMTNRKSYTGFPTSYRWSAYVTSKSPKGWLKKTNFSFFE